MADNLEIAELMDHSIISKYTLDDDNLKQSQLMYDVTQGLSRASETRDLAKLAVAELYAQLDAELRASIAASGEKLSETQIKMQITAKPEMMQVERTLISCERNKSDWAGAVKAIEARGYALSNLGNLYTANYFTKESTGRARDQERDERADRARNLRPQRRGTWEG